MPWICMNIVNIYVWSMQDGKEVSSRCSFHSMPTSTCKQSMANGKNIIHCYPKAFAALNHSKIWVAGRNLSPRFIQLPADRWLWSATHSLQRGGCCLILTTLPGNTLLLSHNSILCHCMLLSCSKLFLPRLTYLLHDLPAIDYLHISVWKPSWDRSKLNLGKACHYQLPTSSSLQSSWVAKECGVSNKSNGKQLSKWTWRWYRLRWVFLMSNWPYLPIFLTCIARQDHRGATSSQQNQQSPQNEVHQNESMFGM